MSESDDSSVTEPSPKRAPRPLARLTCDECGEGFTNKWELCRHRAKVHRPKMNCGFCDREFYRKDELREHERKHIGLGKVLCPQCEKSVSRKHVDSHFRNCHGGRFRARATLVLDSPYPDLAGQVKRSLGGITDLRVEIEEEEAEEGTVTVRMVLTLLVTNRPAVRALLALVEALKGAEWEPEGQ